MRNSKNYINITKSFMKKPTSNSHEVKDAEYYDVKGSKHYIDGKNVLDNRDNGLKRQSYNFIYTSLSIKNLNSRVGKLYELPNRKWINKIILIKNQKLICIYIRKKIDHQPKRADGQSQCNYNYIYYIIYTMLTKFIRICCLKH